MAVTTGISDLLASERGVVFILLMTTITIFLCLGVVMIDQWLEFAKWATVALIASKTVTTAVETVVTKKPQINPPGPPP